MEFVRSTPVTRSWSNTLKNLLLAFGFLGFSAFIFYKNWSVGSILHAIVFIIVGIAGLWTAAVSYTGDCPVCGTRQKLVSGLHRCDQCLGYGEVVNREYREIALSRNANNPVFAIRLPEQWKMPNLCCACGLPSSRFEKLRIIRKKFALDMDAPHCGLHTGGAHLATEPSKEKGVKEVPILKVSSYRFYREFLKANGRGLS
jgi:hypothetical protein